MAQQIKSLNDNLDKLSSILRSTGQKERPHSCKLPSTLHMYTIAQPHQYTHIHTYK